MGHDEHWKVWKNHLDFENTCDNANLCCSLKLYEANKLNTLKKFEVD